MPTPAEYAERIEKAHALHAVEGRYIVRVQQIGAWGKPAEFEPFYTAVLLRPMPSGFWSDEMKVFHFNSWRDIWQFFEDGVLFGKRFEQFAWRDGREDVPSLHVGSGINGGA